MLFPLRPGQGLGPFSLGKPLPEVLVFLQRNKAEYRCVEINYHEKDTLENDVLLRFPEYGFQLHFEPRSQRLRLIQVFDATRLQMVYGRSVVLGGAAHAPSFGRVYEAFGPTYPDDAEAGDAGGYPLQYPGILFMFPAAHPAAAGMTSAAQRGSGAASASPVPLSSVADRIYIHAGTRGHSSAVKAALPPPPPRGSNYMPRLDAVPCQGVYLGGQGCTAALRFGDSPQDIICRLGPPPRVIHKVSGLADSHMDYFYCYPLCGMDLLFEGGTHQLTKVVLHTNLPGHPSFNMYCKANFRVRHSGWKPNGTIQPADGLSREPSGLALHTRSDQLCGVAGVGEAGQASRETVAVAVGEPEGKEATAAGGRGADPAVHAHWKGASNAGERGLSCMSAELQRGEVPSRDHLPTAGPGGAAPAQLAEHGEHPADPAPASGLVDSGAGGVSAAFHRLVGLIDDVITLEPQSLSPDVQLGSPPTPAAHPGGGQTAEARGVPIARGVAGAVPSEAPAASSAGGGGKPPLPPSHAAPTPAPPAPLSVGSKGGKKKGKKKKKKGGAKAGGSEVGGDGHEGDESDSVADTSASNSGYTSLASSPGMVSHIGNTPRLRMGYQSSGWGSTADLAGKEGSVCGGSALDGWSDADDLFPMLAGGNSGRGSEGGAGSCGASPGRFSGGGSPLGRGWERRQGGPQAEPNADGVTKGRAGEASLAGWAAPAAPAASSTSALTAALGGQGRSSPEMGAPLQVVSQGIQTSDTAVGPEDSAGIFCNGGVQLADLEDDDAWLESDSPQGYVIPSVPAEMLDQGGAAAADYERVPLQRNCSTQTPTHLMPAARSIAAGGSPDATWRQQYVGPAHTPITADSKLEEILSAFGHQGGPALHHRLGASHPFGPSYLYAYRGVVFEVLQNGLIATVTLFKA